VARSDCDPPAAPVTSGTDAIDRLSLLRPNLWRYEIWTVSGGAYAVDPEPLGTQGRGFAIPGNSSTARVRLADRTFGLAANGYAYDFAALAWLEGGATTGTLRGRFIDGSGNPITGIADVSWAITNIPTTITWENIKSDDPDFDDPPATNAVLEIFTNGGDVAAGSLVKVSELMGQLDDAWTFLGLELPWRPAKGDGRLLTYEEPILGLNADHLAANPNAKAVVDPLGSGLALAPAGVARIRPITGTTYSLDGTETGRYLDCRNASATTITFTAEATHGLKPFTVIAIRATGAGGFTISAAGGVTVNPKLGGVTGSSGQYDLVQYLYKGADEWDTI